jgi:hypothetical protein
LAWPASPRALFGLYLLFLSVYLVTASGHFWSTDHVAVYNTTQSLAERGELGIKPINDTILGRDGRSYYAIFGIGQSVLSIPLYFIGKIVDRVASPALRRYFAGVPLGDWGGTVPIFFVSLFNQLVAPLICLLVYLFCLRFGFSGRVALLTALVCGLGTPVWVGAREYFQHPLETLLLLGGIYVLFAGRDHPRPRQAVLAGALLAAGVLTRINLLLVLPAVAVYLFALVVTCGTPGSAGMRPLALVTRLTPATAKTLLAFAAPIAAALAAIMAMNYTRFGDVLAFHPSVAGLTYRLSNLPLGLYGNLLSPGRSLFLFAPPVVFALFSYGRFYRRWRAEALLFAALVAIYLLPYSAYDGWPGGWSWGPRFLLATVPLLVIPLGYFATSRARLAAVVLVACLGLGVQVLGVTVNSSYTYWDWARMSLQPADSFLYVPGLSAVPSHLSSLLAGRNVDLWLLWVYQSYGAGAFLATLAVPALLFVAAVKLLRGVQTASEDGERTVAGRDDGDRGIGTGPAEGALAGGETENSGYARSVGGDGSNSIEYL